MSSPRPFWKRAALAGALLCLLARPSPAAPVLEFTQRSVSRSGQFVVYADDAQLRMSVSLYAETAKADILKTLGQGDRWRVPIVITLRQAATTDTRRALGGVGMTETDGGWRIDVDVLLRRGLWREVRFPQLLTRAILTELAYRNRPPRHGVPYQPPPAWLVEGFASQWQAGAVGATVDAALFRQLIASGQLPGLREFLHSDVGTMDATSREIHGACAASLVDMLSRLPNGRRNLGRMLEGLSAAPAQPTVPIVRPLPVEWQPPAPGNLPAIVDPADPSLLPLLPVEDAPHLPAAEASLIDQLDTPLEEPAPKTPRPAPPPARAVADPKPLPPGRDEAAILLAAFPELGGSEAALEKWWTLGIAHRAALGQETPLTVEETDALLAGRLRLRIAGGPPGEKKAAPSSAKPSAKPPAPKPVTEPAQEEAHAEFDVADFKEYLRLPGAKDALLEQAREFPLLQARAHPLLRDMVAQYQLILEELARGKTRRMERRLRELADHRALIVERMAGIEDYLNWYEATQIPEQSHAFEAFLRGAKAAESQAPPRRADAISKYLDQVEREFE